MLIKDYMSPAPVSVQEDTDYKSAFKLMSEFDIHHLPVMNAEDRIVGILGERDLKLAARLYKESPVEITDIMHTPVLTAKPDTPLSEAAEKLIECHIGCLPIINDSNQLVGMLTSTDLFYALRDLLR